MAEGIENGVLKRRVLVGIVVIVAAIAGAYGVSIFQERPLVVSRNLMDEGKVDVAYTTITSYLDTHPDDSRALALQGRLLARMGRPNKAVSIFERCAKDFLDDRADWVDVPTLRDWANSYISLQRYSSAKPILEHAIKEAPDDPATMYDLARCYVLLGDNVDAEPYARKFAAIPGNEGHGNLLLAGIHVDLNNLDEAAKCYGEALKFHPNAEGLSVPPNEFFRAYGSVQAALGNYPEAIKMLTKSLEAQDSVEANRSLGMVYINAGEVTKGRRFLEATLQLSPGDYQARESLANEELKIGKPEEALKWLKPLEQNQFTLSSTAYLIQQAYAGIGNKEKVDEWSAKLEQIRKTEKIVINIEKLLRDQSDSLWGRALRAHRAAVAQDWNEADSLVALIKKTRDLPPFIAEIVESVEKRGPPPSLEKLPLMEKY